MNVTKNKKFKFEQKLNKEALELLEICKEYLTANSSIVKKALMNEIKRIVGNKKIIKFESMLDKFNLSKSLDSNLNEIKKYLEQDKVFLSKEEDKMNAAIDFVNDFYEKTNEKVVISKKDSKRICVKKMYGVKKSQLVKLLGVTESEANQIFSQTKWVDVFVGKYMRTKIFDYIENKNYKNVVLSSNPKVNIIVGNVYRASGINDDIKNMRFVNLDIDFLIPFDNLDTYTLETISTLLFNLEKEALVNIF